MKAESWIQRELVKRFPKADLGKGVDLNHNGRIDRNERIRGDYLAFYQKNRPQLIKLGGIFEWGQSFKPDNPIHDILSIESEVATDSQIRGAYTYLQAVLKNPELKVGTPQQRVFAFYDLFIRFGFRRDPNNTLHFLSFGIDGTKFDCDLFSFEALIAGHELGWPVKVVNNPGHTYVRWDDQGGTRFNFDEGEFQSDQFYNDRYHLQHTTAYPQVLNLPKLQSHVYFNRASVKIDRQNYPGALSDLGIAIQLDPQNCTAYNSMGVIRMKLSNGSAAGAAIAGYDQAIRCNSDYVIAHTNKASALMMLGRYAEAVQLLTPMAAKHPQETELHTLLFQAHLKLGAKMR